MSRTTELTRRDAVRTIAGAAGVAGLAGAAEAGPDEEIEVNVGFANAAGERAAKREATDVVREFTFDAFTARMPATAADALSANPNVRYVEENGEMRALAQDVPYGVPQVNADDAISAGLTGSGADVAVIDTGIDADHPDLQGNLGAGGYAVACEGSCVNGWDDDNGHGTHCAGTVGAINNSRDVVGVSPGVTLHAVKVLGSRGAGSYSDIAAGIEYTANQGWDVGSLSLGGGFSSAVADACTYAYNNGVLLVAAAGNSGPCSDCVGYPAALDECIAVSAVDSGENLASFSSTGPEVELAAPGVEVESTYLDDTTRFLSGTSMACPHVSGVGALLMNNGYSNTNARSRLQNTATNLGLTSDEQGFGQVDAKNALGL